MTPRHTVIFDFDGTLANTVDLVFDLYNQHAESYGAQRITREEFPALRRLGYKKAMKAKHIRWSVLPKLVLFIAKEMRQHMDQVEPYPGVVEALYTLQERGYSIGVLTSNQLGLVQDFFATHQFPAFDFVVSEKTMFGKEKALHRIMKRHHLQKEQIIYVGDEPRDVSASRKADVKVIGVSWGAGGTEGFELDVPDRIVATVPELLTAIDDLF
jgi:HAD superfamily hydrolase (TIGR01549 family)